MGHNIIHIHLSKIIYIYSFTPNKRIYKRCVEPLIVNDPVILVNQ